MSAHMSDEALVAFLLGDDEAEQTHLAECEDCARKLDALAEGAMLADDTGDAASRVWRRLAASLAAEGQFLPFLDRLAALWQLGEAATRAVLTRAANPDNWLDFLSGSRLLHLEAGPALAGMDAGLVFIPAGSEFPRHKHSGDERVLVLQGGFVDSDTGVVLKAGEAGVAHLGSAHSLRALGEEACVYAVITAPVEFC